MKIAFLFEKLDCWGGAQRAVTFLMNQLAQRDFDITLYTFDKEGASAHFPLDAKIHWQQLGESLPRNQTSWIHILPNRFLDRVRLLRRLIQEDPPVVLISFINFTNLLCAWVGYLTGIPTILSERSNPKKKKLPLHWSMFREIVYPLSSAVVLQSRDVQAMYSSRIRRKAVTIPNPVIALPESEDEKGEWGDLKKPCLISVGRLRFVKGFDLLIQAFSLIHSRYPDWQLAIVGEGPEKASLDATIHNLGMQDKVILTGFTSEPQILLKRADLYVSASRWEGFPNALAEAMALGLPVVATDCPYGPSDMVRHRVDGILCPNEDVEALADALDDLMGDHEKRIRMGQAAKEVLTRFHPDCVVQIWEDLIKKVAPLSNRAQGA